MRESVEWFGNASGCSHDVRTHLNILLSAVAMIESERLGPNQVKEYIGMIKQNALAMLRLVNHFLDDGMNFSDAEVVNRDIQIDGALRAVVEGVKPYATLHELEFLEDIDSPLYATCNEEMLQRVLNNLLSNAIKCTESGGFIYLSARRNGAWVEISVADTGCGLSQSRQMQLAGQTDSQTELGLGLKLVKSMMEAMRAQISFTSRERVGTTFYLRFPAADCVHAPPAVREESPFLRIDPTFATQS